jgi:hypothetical protein
MSLTRTTVQVISALSLCAALGSMSGCDLLDGLEDSGGLVNFYSAHHPTARDGGFPDKPPGHIEFDTDEGWHVIIASGQVTTTAIELHRCDGASVPADLYWGAVEENLIDPDLIVTGVGGVEAESGNYCAATITYAAGPSEGDVPSVGTVYLRGVASKDGEEVQFDLRASGSVDVEVDISSIEDGGPLTLDHDQYLAKQLTVAKTYDRFFDGVDFHQLDAMDTDAILLDTLRFETTIVLGTEIAP